MKIMKKMSTLALVLLLLVCLSAPVLAEYSSVTYIGGAEKFVFFPGSEYTDSDLFQNFMNVMPGDVLTETIIVKSDATTCDYVNIYMRAVTHEELDNPLSEKVAEEENLVSMLDFLSQLYMTVKQGDEVIYSASPDELDGLQDEILLGRFRRGTEKTLTVELSVPIELGNEYSYRVGEVDWQFRAEEFNDPIVLPEKEEDTPAEPGQEDIPSESEKKPTDDPNHPYTGDENPIALYVGLFALGLAAVICAWFLSRKKQKD